MTDYKKKYDEVLAKAKEIHRNEVGKKIDMEWLFPELKESKDDKIRKWLICTLKSLNNSPVQIDGAYEMMLPAIAWLEKQGEQKPIDKVEPKFKVKDWVAINPELRFASPLRIKDIDDNNYRVESVDGNSGVPTIDYLDNHYHLWTIQDAKDGDVLVDSLPFIFKRIDSLQRSYAYCGISVDDGFKIESDGEFGEWTWMQDIKPATKEQRNLLFQKMKEAGYEWDAEHRQLKKIEQNPAWSEEDLDYYAAIIAKLEVTQDDALLTDNQMEFLKSLKERVQPQSKQEWSEEDDKNLKRAIQQIDLLEEYTNDGSFVTEVAKQSSLEVCRSVKNWLQSLRPQNKYAYNPYKAVVESIADMVEKYASFDSNLQDFYDNVKVKCKDAKEYDSLYPQNRWKPSDEQIEALEHFVRSIGESGFASPYDSNTKLVYSLLSELKKLREDKS